MPIKYLKLFTLILALLISQHSISASAETHRQLLERKQQFYSSMLDASVKYGKSDDAKKYLAAYSATSKQIDKSRLNEAASYLEFFNDPSALIKLMPYFYGTNDKFEYKRKIGNDSYIILVTNSSNVNMGTYSKEQLKSITLGFFNAIDSDIENDARNAADVWIE